MTNGARFGTMERKGVMEMKNKFKWHSFWACLALIGIVGAMISGHRMIHKPGDKSSES